MISFVCAMCLCIYTLFTLACLCSMAGAITNGISAHTRHQYKMNQNKNNNELNIKIKWKETKKTTYFNMTGNSNWKSNVEQRWNDLLIRVCSRNSTCYNYVVYHSYCMLPASIALILHHPEYMQCFTTSLIRTSVSFQCENISKIALSETEREFAAKRVKKIGTDENHYVHCFSL